MWGNTNDRTGFRRMYVTSVVGSRVDGIGNFVRTVVTGQLKMAVPLMGLGIARLAVWSYIFIGEESFPEFLTL